MLEVLAKFEREKSVSKFQARGMFFQAYQVPYKRSSLLHDGSVGRFYAKQIAWDQRAP